jgi:carbonic anhydrase
MIKRVISFVFIILILVSFVAFGEELDPLKKLIEGNRRFVSGNLATKDFSEAKRKELAKGQKPFAVVVGCSDSRVPPEIIFDQGLGDIFVVRVAGNVLDPISLGSIEYAVEHLKTPLIVILGHTHCGAVKATIEATTDLNFLGYYFLEYYGYCGAVEAMIPYLKGIDEVNIYAIVNKILPAVAKAKKDGIIGEDLLNKAIEENVLLQKEYMLKHSRIIREFVEAGEVQIVTAIYDIESGEVKFIQ